MHRILAGDWSSDVCSSDLAAGLPELALARGTAVIEVNPEPTPLTASATLSIREPASQALPGLLQRLPALLK
jgi:NAD-dependent deacetylase